MVAENLEPNAPLKSPYPYFEDRSVIEYALKLIRDGVLRVDENGYIWREAILSSHRKNRVWIEPRRAENVGGKGYLRLSFQMPNKQIKCVMAHRVVWEWANGPIPFVLQVNHKDLNKQNNSLSNLELVTPSGNMQHSYDNGRVIPWGENITSWRGKPRISKETMVQVKQDHAAGLSYPKLSLKYDISKTQIGRICNDQVSKHGS